MSAWETYLREHHTQYIDELMDFLRIPSVSSLPEHADDIQRAAVWVAARMERAGFEEVSILPTGGHPVVVGEWKHAGDKPTILIYGHFDTQPADPSDAWDQPPFEPVIKNECIFARGASDDKGNMLIPILAVEALLNSEGVLPVNVVFMFEGQEEIGSPQIPQFIEKHKELLTCDLVISADGLQWREDQPALFLGFKGICALQIDLKGPDSDLHSGIFGGAVQNPLHALVHVLDTMRSKDGRIAVDGFYENVQPLSDEDRSQIAAVPYDETHYKAQVGIDDVYGEADYTTYERAWARPTLEINGIWGGFQGDGVKAVLPSEAHAKITCRLVADQTPEQVVDAIEQHIATHTPAGVSATVRRLSSHAYPYSMACDHPGNRAAHDVLKGVYGKDPYYVRLGGSLPICTLFLNTLGVYTVMFGFCLEDENIHAPNEYFRIRSFRRGLTAYGRLLNRLATF